MIFNTITFVICAIIVVSLTVFFGVLLYRNSSQNDQLESNTSLSDDDIDILKRLEKQLKDL